MSNLLHNLNEQQLAAVTLPSQHALILAGAGSGKTRVLTTRIAWLIQNGIVSPAGILAVTFTNKAAKEMTARLGAMLPINIRGMWLGTFHGLCNRFLRAHHRDARLPQTFQILDTGDQLAAVKRVMKVLQVDEDKFPPRQVQYFIADAKEKGERAGDIAVVDEISRRYAEIYAAYDEQCQKEGVVDFAELLLRSFELLSRNEILCEHYRNRFRHILVDEFQDTNVLQYRWLKLLSGPGSSIFAVGDDDQCLAEGTKVTMADGRRRAIERVQAGDKVLSAFGSGEFRPATVMRVHRGRAKRGLITLHTRGGKKLSSTPEHTHFAGYRLGETPQTYLVYLMHKAGIGYRLGTSQVYTRGQARPMVGFRQRSLQEHAHALWVVGTHASENEARAEEILLSLRYGLPTLPFVPRKGKKAVNGLVHDATFIRRVFDSLDTDKAARALLADRGLSPDEPHHLPQSRDSNRRNISITLCGDRRGLSPMHRIAIVGNDAEGRAALAALGLSVRPAKKGSRSWRFETGRKDFGELMRIAERCRKALGARYVLKANLNGKSLPFIRAASVQPGMAIVDDEGNFDTVSRVERERRGAAVCDLDVFPTHNYIAGGVVTHNSIYRFRGANVGNMADFERDFRVENVIRLEQNYRSQGNILSAANQLITHNRNRLGKNLWTAAGEGEPIRVYEAASDGYEAAWLVEEVQTLVREQGMARRDIAFLYRSNAQSRVLEHALFSAGIPYRVYGGQRFFERMEIKHALAYLRLLANTDDDGAFLRVANFPARGIGARTLEQLQDAAAAAGVSLYLAARQLQGAASLKVGVFLRIIDTLRAETAELPLPEVVEHMLERSGLLAHYRAERDGADRVDNLNELINAAASFEQEEPMVLPPMEEVAPPLPGPAAAQGDGGLFDAPVSAPEQPAAAAGAPGEAPPPTDPLGLFLAHAALESGENQAAEGMDALQMMTVHSAKGLEFHAVFITGLEEGLFPHEQSVMEDDGLEEERRLMYVAITRARTRLYLSFAKTRLLHGQTRYNIASRFLDEVPDELIKWLTPKLGSGIAADPGWLSSPSSSSATAPPKSRDPGHGYRIGQTVSHAKFGQGVIVSAEGTGTDARLQINFGRQGMKWLALEFAKLTPV